MPSALDSHAFDVWKLLTDSDLNSTALKTCMILPLPIIQMPSATSKAKEHSAAMVARRLAPWRQGDLNILMKEVKVYILNYILHAMVFFDLAY